MEEELIIKAILGAIIWAVAMYFIVFYAVKNATNTHRSIYEQSKTSYLLERMLTEQGIDINEVKVLEIETGKTRNFKMDDYIQFMATHSSLRFKMIK